MRQQGIVRCWKRTFGFIDPTEGGQGVFVHHTAILAEGFRKLVPGDRVYFDVETSEKGRPQAARVRVIEPAAGG